ncbi:MAG: RDD family protein, partial [Acidimicrobiales bacterium]
QRLGGALVDGAAFQLAVLGLAGLDTTVAAALSTAAYLAYVVGLTAVRGQTLGKMALGTRVVDAGTGALPTLWQASTRTVVPLAGLVVDVALGTAAVGAFWVLTVYGWLLVDERRRGLHDRAAGTVVVDVARSEAHRRVGVVAVVAAVAVTAVLVAVALDELEEQPLTAPHADGG